MTHMRPSDEVSMPGLPIIQEAAAFAASAPRLSDLLEGILQRGLRAVGGHRGFIAKVDLESGLLVIQCGAGSGWTKEKLTRRLQWHAGEGKGITTYVAATGAPYWSPDVSKDPYYLKYFDDVVSEIAVPVLDFQRRTRAVINVDSPKPHAFDKGHVDVLLALANIAGMWLQIDEHRNRERAFVGISTRLLARPDIHSLVHKVIRIAADMLSFEDCSLFLIDEGSDILKLVGSRGTLSRKVGKVAYTLGDGLTGWIAKHGQAIRTSDPRSDPRWRGIHCEFPPEDMGAFLGVPIRDREGVIGVFRVLRRRSKFKWFNNEFTPEEEGVLASLGIQIGAAVQNLRLKERIIEAGRMAAWGEMSARLAHMMGNRVFAVKGDLNELEYQLSQSGEDCRRFQELTESIHKGVFRLEEILQEFRDFVLATQLTLSNQDINEIVEQTVEEIFPKRSPVRLQMELASDLPTIQADPTKLKRCFAELVENAVSFQDDGGLLQVTTCLAAPKEARNRCALSGKRRYIRIEFADQGPGIPNEAKEQIFTPFYTSRAKGMGLGLSIVKGIVEAHQGRICEAGVSGSGARFLIFLPAGGRS